MTLRCRDVLRFGGLVSAVVLGVLIAHGYQHGHLQPHAPGRVVADASGAFIAAIESSSGGGYGHWPISAIPQRVVRATLALEDRRFSHHPGVDPLAVARALVSNLTSRRRVGASTLAMQLARMQRPGARTIWRKLTEMSSAVFMTARHGREAVLRGYLSRVPYGNRIHGIGAAAQTYFAKPPADLSWAEIAFLTAIPQAPRQGNPYATAGRERTVARARLALARLHGEGVLGGSEWRAALQQLTQLRVLPRPRRPATAMHAIVAMRSQLAGRPDSPPMVNTTLDMGLQRRTTGVVAAALDRFRNAGAEQAAAVVVRLQDFAVRTWVGSSGYADRDGAIDYVRVPRSAGSTLKPFAYAMALERGVIKPDTVLFDVPGRSGISNADRGFLGPLLPRQALANSRNLPAVRVLRRLGLHRAYWTFAELGLHRAHRAPEHYGLGVVLGALPVTLEHLVTAYGALASDGRLRPLRWFAHDVGVPRSVLSQASARLVTTFLADPQARMPSFQRMGLTDLGAHVALKTGTSQGYRDAWALVWSRTHLVGVWFGRPDAQPMDRLTGASAAAVAGVVLRLADRHEDGGGPFPSPAGYRPATLCATTGMAMHAGCSRASREWLSQLPRRARVRHTVLDSRTGRRADASTPARFARLVSVVGALPLVAGHSSLAATPTLRIVSPPPGARLVRLPDVPASRQSVGLRAAGVAPGQLLHWSVDGRPFATAPADASVRWQLWPGHHRVSVRADMGREHRHEVTLWVE